MTKQQLSIANKAIVAVIIAAAVMAVVLQPTEKPEITGQATAEVRLFVSGVTFGYNCNLTLIEGWNLISIPCRHTNATISLMLENITGYYQSVHSYDANDQEDQWKSFNPSLPVWVEQDLKVINSSRGYWIRISNKTSLNITGTITLPSTIRLEPNWNLVGYPTNKSTSPEEAFLSINSSIASVHAYNTTDNSDYWKVWAPSLSGSFNDLKLIVPYWGYWINATAAADWTILQN